MARVHAQEGSTVGGRTEVARRRRQSAVRDVVLPVKWLRMIAEWTGRTGGWMAFGYEGRQTRIEGNFMGRLANKLWIADRLDQYGDP